MFRRQRCCLAIGCVRRAHGVDAGVLQDAADGGGGDGMVMAACNEQRAGRGGTRFDELAMAHGADDAACFDQWRQGRGV